MELFVRLFDFNDDGKLDTYEQAVEFSAFMNMIDFCKNDELDIKRKMNTMKSLRSCK